jgi:hypothetical protein
MILNLQPAHFGKDSKNTNPPNKKTKGTVLDISSILHGLLVGLRRSFARIIVTQLRGFSSF